MYAYDKVIAGWLEDSRYDSDAFSHLTLRDSEGLKQDLVGRIKEVFDSFAGQKIGLEYIVCKKEFSWDDAITGWLLHLDGATVEDFQEHKSLFSNKTAIVIGYEAVDYRYSSLTSGTDYNSNLKIGGHDLYQELTAYASNNYNGRDSNYCLVHIFTVENDL